MTINTRSSFNSWWWGTFETEMEVTFHDLKVTYESGSLQQQTRLVQPPPVTVDPPPFAYLEDAVFDISTNIQGRLTIDGGEEVEENGDKILLHNTGYVGDAQSVDIRNRIAPRMIQTGEDQFGNQIFEHDVDPVSYTHLTLPTNREV